MNKLSLTLGGQPRTLLFDFGTLDHLEQLTGSDPLDFAFDIKSYASMKAGVSTLIFAGLLTACDVDGTAPDFSKEDIEKWGKRLMFHDIVSVLNAWGKVKSATAPGEGSGDTQ